MDHERISVYKLLERIDSGGFGTVYVARDMRSHEIVAVKVLNTELSNRPGFRSRFGEEAQMLRALPDHPSIVGLLDFGEDGDRPYLVMEYLAGHDLHQLLGDGPLPVGRAISIASEVARTLAFAVEGGLIHCDIKPANIRILPGDRVKIMDFGIARAADSSFRRVAGTHAYMAPELWQGLPDPATDVYALGCVLYEMLVGRPPFVSSIRNVRDEQDLERKREEMKQLHLSAEPDWSPFHGEAVLSQLLDLLRRLLAKDSRARPQASAAAVELELVADLVPAGERPDGGGLRIDSDATHIDVDQTRFHGDAIPGTAAYDIATTPVSQPEPIPTDIKVHIQRHLQTLDLDAQACYPVVVHEQRGELFAATVEGRVWKLDLRSGRSECWDILSPDLVRSHRWGFAAHGDRMLFHAGDATWTDIDSQTGEVKRRGVLPEAGITLSPSGRWLYMTGTEKRVYLASWDNPDERTAFDIGARPTGAVHVGRGVVFVPSSRGLIWLNMRSGQATLVGPDQTARAVTPLYGGRIVVVYSTVDDSGNQRSIVRLFDISASRPAMLAEVAVVGQCAGPAQVSGDRVILTCRDGRVRAWDAVRDEPQQGSYTLEPAWPEMVEVGPGVQSGAALAKGLLALTPCRDNEGSLVVLDVPHGRVVYEHVLTSDVFAPPIWWGDILCIATTMGFVEVFRAVLLSDHTQSSGGIS